MLDIVFAFGILIIWVSILLFVAHTGGWANLAERYADIRDVPGKTYYMRSGYIGSVNYKSCLILRVSEAGLRLSVLFPFRIGHPPLFIPWDEFHTVSEKRVFFFRFLDASVGMPVVAKVLLPIWIRDYFPSERVADAPLGIHKDSKAVTSPRTPKLTGHRTPEE